MHGVKAGKIAAPVAQDPCSIGRNVDGRADFIEEPGLFKYL